MATLNIEGRKVKVDDAFLQLSPEEQDRTVNEIASQIGVKKVENQQPPKTAPAGRHLTYEEGLKELEKEKLSGTWGEAGSFLTGVLDIPIAGPAIKGLYQRGAAGLASMIDGESYDTNLEQARSATQTAQEQNPVANTAGMVVGNIAAMAPIGTTSIGARALGITGATLAGRAGMSALSSGAISAADTAARGGTGADIIGSGAIGGGIGGAIPIVGAGLSAAGRAVGERVTPLLGAISNPIGEAQRRVGVALRRDMVGNPSSLMSQADEAVAARSGVPVLNVDRGGETTQALARSVANQSPEARGIIEKTASDRFAGQSNRAMSFINRLTGGNADDLALQETLKRNARAVNKPAYDAAFKSPQAQQVYTPRIQQLMQSPSFRQAVDSVPRRSADRAAVDGFKEIGNPFIKNSQGAYVLSRKADGSIAVPSLQFWDQVKINLDDKISTARRAGKNALAADMTALKQALVEELDSIVPVYKNARAGAAAFFGAEDALEAGKKFADTPRLVPEAKKAFQAFKPAEKEAFATGYASELIDRIRSSGDRTNVINSVFKNQSARDSIELVFGPQKAKELEAYVRVEDLVDRVRGTMGNSTTARQLVELGLGAGVGGGIGYTFSGDLQGAAMGAAIGSLRGGMRMAGQRADAKVMEQMAKLLTSSNRANLALAIKQAAAQPAYMRALETLGAALAVPARTGGIIAAQAAVQ